MTQIITFLDPNCVYLVSDRRLTLLDGSLHDDHTNKCVIYDGRVAFAFTGLAEFDGSPMHEWLTTTLAASPSSELAGAANYVAERATSSLTRLRHVPARKREVTFIGAGWARLPDGLHRVRLRISNRHPTGGLQASFNVGTELFASGGRPATFLAVDGRPMAPAEHEILAAVLRHHRRHRSDPDAISASLVASIRRSARFDDTIGRRALTAVLPRAAVLKPTGEMWVGFPQSSSMSPSFRYWEDGLWNGITYGPSAAYPGGGAFTNFESGPIFPELRTLVDRGEDGFTIRFPVAVLRLPDGGIACVTRVDGARALLVYADDELMMRAISGACRGALPIPIDSVLDLDNVLLDLSAPVDAVLFDPDPQTMRPREWLTAEQVHNRRVERFGPPS